MLLGPLRYHLPDSGAVLPKKCGGCRAIAMLVRVREDPVQSTIIGLLGIDRVMSALLPVMLGERVVKLAKRIDPQPAREHRLFAGDLGHQLVDVFKLLQGRPAGVALAPIRARRQPDRKRLREIFVGMALSVPKREVLDVTLAGRLGPIIARVAL